VESLIPMQAEVLTRGVHRKCSVSNASIEARESTPGPAITDANET